MRLKTIVLLTGLTALLFSLTLNGVLLTRRDREGPIITAQNQRLIDRTMRMDAARNHNALANTERLVRPLVVDFAREVCVQLYPGPGVVGGKTITCYDRKSERVTRYELFGQ